jgi:Zn-dependent protease
VRPTVRLLGTEFGRRELREVLIASLSLTVIFAAGLAHGLGNPAFFQQLAFFLPPAFLGAVPGFFLALSMQKRVGARAGCTVEFRLSPQWVALSLILAFAAGVAFGVAGGLSRFGNLTRSGAGRMAAAGPLAYMAIGGAALAAALALRATGQSYGLLTAHIVAQVDAWLALFSMIPVQGFSGHDIYRWSKLFYLALLVAAAGVFFAAGVV